MKQGKVSSVRDGGMRAMNFSRDLKEYGQQMLSLWPELGDGDYAAGHENWLAFDNGVVEAFDAKNPGILVMRNEKGAWTIAPKDYKKGSASDQVINAKWVRGVSRPKWADMKKNSSDLYSIALTVRLPVTDAIKEAHRVLRDAVNRAQGGAGRKAKSANREFGQVLKDFVSDLDARIKSGLTRKTIDAKDADTIRAWLSQMPKI